MKKLISAVLVLLAVYCVYPDDKAIYVELLQKGRLGELETHLQFWIKREPSNPEVYIAFFNYFLRLDRQSVIALEKNDLTNLYVLSEQTRYNEANVLSGLEYLDRGLAISPNRLDMHFGKIKILEQINDYKNQSIALDNVLRLSKANNNAWLWSDNEPVKDAKGFLLNNIQDYFMAWFNIGTKESLDALYKSSCIEIEVYPDEVYGYNNLALFYARNKNYKTALECLLKAERINPKDYIVINNIAQSYLELNNRVKAREYFEKLLQFPQDVDPEYVRKKLDSL